MIYPTYEVAIADIVKKEPKACRCDSKRTLSYGDYRYPAAEVMMGELQIPADRRFPHPLKARVSCADFRSDAEVLRPWAAMAFDKAFSGAIENSLARKQPDDPVEQRRRVVHRDGGLDALDGEAMP